MLYQEFFFVLDMEYLTSTANYTYPKLFFFLYLGENCKKIDHVLSIIKVLLKFQEVVI